MKNIWILFWWKSAEHEVSLKSAKNVYENINKKLFNPVLIKIDKSGKWIIGDIDLFDIEVSSKTIGIKEVFLSPQSKGDLRYLENWNSIIKLDCVIPMMHGTFAEDWTIQWLLKLVDIPFVWADTLGSAVWMDKWIMKKILRDEWIPIWRFDSFKSFEKIPEYEEILKRLWKVLFIKPANLGSSVGINKVQSKEEYNQAVKEAFLYDEKILIEEFLDWKEVECAVLGNHNPKVSLPWEAVSEADFYSYDAKYKQKTIYHIPAQITSSQIEQVQQLAIKTFKVLWCSGLWRVDIFVTTKWDIFVNEINTLPWFTSSSMYPMLIEKMWINFTELITKLIFFAEERYKQLWVINYEL